MRCDEVLPGLKKLPEPSVDAARCIYDAGHRGFHRANAGRDPTEWSTASFTIEHAGEPPYVSRFQLSQDTMPVDIRLTRLHAFVGPNNAGKQTLMREINVHCDKSATLVICPECGLHPMSIVHHMQALRERSQNRQILIKTHSPLVINEMQPDEVTIISRIGDVTRATPIALTPNFKERSKIYALGELWVSYCDGVEDSLKVDQ